MQSRAERQHQTDGHRSPDDSEDGQECAQLLAANVADQLLEDVLEGDHRYEISFGGRSTSF